MKAKGRTWAGGTLLSWLLLAGIWTGTGEGALLREQVELVKQIGGSALSVALQEDLAYLGLGPTLHILDVKVPESPEPKGRVLLPGLVKGVAVSGRYAYVANGKGGLRIVHVAIPSSPREVGAIDLQDYVPDIPEEAIGIDLSVQGGRTYAYVAAGKEGLRVIDVSTPSAPREVASYPSVEELEGSAEEEGGPVTEVRGVHIASQGDRTYAYVVGERMGSDLQKKGVWILDVSDPTSPRLATVSHPLDPQAPRAADLPIAGQATGIDLSNGYIYVAAGEGGLTVAMVATDGLGAITALQEMGRYQAEGFATGVVVSGPYAYVAYGKRGLRVIQVESPSFLREVGTYRTLAEGKNEAMPTFAHGLAMTGSYVYLASGRLGLEVVELLNPAAPKRVANYHDTIGFVSGFFASGQDACAAAGPYGFDVLKMTDPLSIEEIEAKDGVTLYYTDPEFEDLFSFTQAGIFIAGGHPREGDTGGHLFVTFGGFGLALGDIKPDFTGTAGFYPPAEPKPDEVVRFAAGISVVGTTAYLADRDAGLIVLDVTNPLPHVHPNPVKRIGQLVKPEVDWAAEGVLVAGRGANQYAYVAAGEAGLRIVDVTDPSDLKNKVIGVLPTPAPAVAIFVLGNYAYLAAGDLLVVDVSDPQAPVQRGRYDIPGRATWLQVAGGLAYVVDQAGSLWVIDLSDPDHLTELGRFDTPGQVQGVFLAGGYAYVSDGDGGLLILRYRPPIPPGPSLVLDRSNLWFGEVVLDTSQKLTLTLSNRSTETSVGIGGLWVEGEPFSLDGAPSAPFFLLPGESQEVPVRFSPTTVGLQSGSVMVVSDGLPEGALTIPLAGQGILPPDIRPSPPSLSFEEGVVNDSQELDLLLFNDGQGILTVRELSVNNDRFAVISPEIPFQVAPGGSRRITVRFSPTSSEPQQGTLRVVSNDPDEEGTLEIALVGNGIPIQLAINGGEGSTVKRKVTLEVSVPPEVTQARFSNDGSKWTAWRRVSRVQSWTLGKGSGPKQVWGEFKTRRGRVLRANDTITLQAGAR
ncbi:MAG: choice-of-anchor D domain-containing protein [Candidatus Tectomicrobia bacterium]|uniref:Choice-of-anchor D domain-containing protein n=1 Tax=Tectimicrobiota bacterium TaxID=2528274 RepID=A0A932FWG7_UNCTE|nr:choice-of-anchor D domain-containing protein [Candidatus Tectomicrobia bacterium]